MTDKARELTPDEMSFVCDPDQFQFDTTDDLPDLESIIGQERAIRAIDFGVQMPGYGFNIYVTGLSGSGRSTTIQRFLERKAREEPVPDDWCYVNNFADPRRPVNIHLPAGHGIRLRDDMAEFIRDLQQAFPVAYDSEDYSQRMRTMAQELDQARNEVLKKMGETAKAHGFALMQAATGLGVVPMVDDQMVTPEQFGQLPEEVRSKFEADLPEVQQALERTMREVRAMEKAAKKKMRALSRQVADSVVGDHMNDLLEEYAAFDQVVQYLGEVRNDIVENVSDFRPRTEQEEAGDQPDGSPFQSPRQPASPASPLSRYQVNVIVDHSHSQGAPVVYETNPTYLNLVGRIEQEIRYGVMTIRFNHIRAGCLHRANGGYLVIEARDLLESPLAWDALKRAIKNREIRTEVLHVVAPTAVTTSLEPECIPFQAKVILVGDWSTYALLYDLDDTFRKIFKVRADFGSWMERTPEAMQRYAEFVASRVRADNLLPFDRLAVARIIESGTQLVEHKERLSARFAGVIEVIQESSYWAGRNGHSVVTRADVDRAEEERRYRASHVQEQLQKSILEGTIRVETGGEAIGQVNGLSVLDVADDEFGVPSRISAKTYMGRGNVVAIDREVNLTGNIHNKGVLILQGYLGGKYAGEKALNLSASITFEQNYARIEGDSASSAELYALLSSLSQVPIRQDLAVTGSVDQEGRVQSIGAATAKIEGFFDICQARGLTGDQGVLIPAANVRHLVLRSDVVEAVRDGKFHIYAVETVDQGIELLTGTPAGEADEDGHYPEGTISFLVRRRLMEMAQEKRAGEEEEETGDEAPSGASLADPDQLDGETAG
jgi:predicted ATP-dependent protease